MHKQLSVLKRGDKIIVVAPAGKVKQDDLEYGIQILKSWGLVVELGKNIFSNNTYFSSDDEKRLSDFQEALNNEEYKAIFCARGGYGSVRIVEKIDWQHFLKNPKWIIGYSDITIILNKIQLFNIPCIHGPMLASFNKYKTNESLNYLHQLLFNGFYSFRLPLENIVFFKKDFSYINEIITGGNLSLLENSIGTSYALQTKNKILFIEDVDEYPYKIDKMLHHLYHSGYLTKTKGIILGNFNLLKQDCKFPETIEETLKSFLIHDLEFIINKFPAGHDQCNYPLVFGNKIKIVKEKVQLSINITLSTNDFIDF